MFFKSISSHKYKCMQVLLKSHYCRIVIIAKKLIALTHNSSNSFLYYIQFFLQVCTCTCTCILFVCNCIHVYTCMFILKRIHCNCDLQAYVFHLNSTSVDANGFDTNTHKKITSSRCTKLVFCFRKIQQ